jgi:hypothetical protein
MSLLGLLNEYGIEYHEHGKNIGTGWYGFACPFHNDPSHHLGYNIGGNYFSCWNCGPIRAYDLLKEWGIPYEEYKIAFGTGSVEKRHRRHTKGKLKYPEGYKPTLETVHKTYLKSRGFNPEKLIKIWKIGSIGLASRLAWRLFIPVYFQGEVVSWTTRSLSNEGARYINARPEEENLPIRSVLYGLDHVRHSALVVEGPTGVWKIGPGTICTFGITYTNAQLHKISKIPFRAIAFDPEPDAQRRAKRLADSLSVFPGTTKVVELDSNDPGSLKPKDVQLLREEFIK